MRALLARIREIAPSLAPVVIEGETGTGKELVAEAIHETSSRAQRPYRIVDCASVSRDLIESELFGHVRGAFTGATTDREGAFEDAHTGTIFIDEIGELPLDLQPKLLRVLEKMELRRVGSQSIKKIDVRILAATNRNLEREVEEGRFRRDLFFRLGVVRLHLPPLRERPEDIVMLAQRFFDEFSSRTQGPIPLSDDIQQRLLRHTWPGNVRELRNVIDRGAALSDDDFHLPEDFGRDSIRFETHETSVALLPRSLPRSQTAPLLPPGEQTRPLWFGRTYKEAKEVVMADFESGYIRALLDAHHGNVSAAARAAGIHRNILHRMIARYKIKR